MVAAAKSYTLEEIKELREVLGFGEKHDVSSTTPSAQALHGLLPGSTTQYGVFTSPGVRPGMFNATARVRTLASRIPLMRSEYLTEIIEIMTGVTAGSGNNATSACADAPKSGSLKTCQQQYTFGIVHLGTKVDDITQIGMYKNRADVPREFYNQALLDNQWLPNVPGLDGAGSNATRLRSAFYTLGIELERSISPVVYTGVAGTEDNAHRGIAREWAGLDGLIKTGYTDAVTGLACARADSIVETYNAAITGSDGSGRSFVEAMHDLYFAAVDRASQLNMGDVTWAFSMRPDQFRAATEQWACAFATYRCAGTAAAPNNRDGMEIYAMRVDMFNGHYLLIDGVRVPVILDDSIARETLGNNYYKADIYLVALDWAGMPLLYAQYFPQDNPEATEYANFIGGDLIDTRTFNNGLYRVFKRVTKGCLEFDAYARVRLILDAPFLSGRLDDVFYNAYAKVQDPLIGQSYHSDGGVTYRL